MLRIPTVPGRSRQQAFAANLSKNFSGGTAIYKPIPKASHSGLVGDIGFFNDQGKYEWLHNAFFEEV
jgi:hypothetical protein